MSLDTPGGIPPSPGRMNVDFEERVDFTRLRAYRLARAREALDASELGAVLLFDINNIRYVSATMIGEWARDKVARYALLTRGGRADRLGLRFRGPASSAALRHGSARRTAARACSVFAARWRPMPDSSLVQWRRFSPSWRPPASRACRSASTSRRRRCCSSCSAPASRFATRSRSMLDARLIKSADEIALLSTAAAMVDGVYQDIAEALKPGVRENEIVALANKRLYEMGSDDVEAINAVSGERCNPHPHNFSDRLIRPGDQAYFDIIQSFNGYRTCYYRTFAVGRSTPAQRDAYARAREWIDAAIEIVQPGTTTDQIARLWPEATDFGFASEMAAFGLQFGHGLGLGLHERPIISRLNSLDHPIELREGMVFALETYCPATDGQSAARIEEEVVVTSSGCSVLTLFPAEELFVTNKY